MTRYLGITRERVFSPGRVEDDTGILRQVADNLRQRGHDVTVLDGDSETWPQPEPTTVVFAMCQGPRALECMQEWQRRGVRIVNAPEGILNCQRHRTIPLLQDAGVGLPQSVLMDTREYGAVPAWVSEAGAWIKRGDVHATEADDVVYLTDAGVARDVLDGFRRRGIRAAVLQRHVPGRVLKFYSVLGSFFHCVVDADSTLPAEVLGEIDRLGQVAARRLGVEVYGGDCVYGKRGVLSLIDLNDWPSYRSCRASAAEAIAVYLEAQKVATSK